MIKDGRWPWAVFDEEDSLAWQREVGSAVCLALERHTRPGTFDLLDKALVLRRGPALANITGSWVTETRAALEHERLLRAGRTSVTGRSAQTEIELALVIRSLVSGAVTGDRLPFSVNAGRRDR